MKFKIDLIQRYIHGESSVSTSDETGYSLNGKEVIIIANTRKTVYNNICSPEKLAQVNPENIQLGNDFLEYLTSIQFHLENNILSNAIQSQVSMPTLDFEWEYKES